MINRLLQLIIRSYARGPIRTFAILALTANRILRWVFVGKELIDVSKVKPGEVIVIEQLAISHREQIRQFKKADRKAKRAARRERREARSSRMGRILRSGSGRERHSA